MVKRSAIILATALGLGACQHGSGSVPAVLEDGSEDTMAAVKSSLEETVGRTNFEFGVGDPTTAPQIIVLPPPLSPHEDRSPAMPTVFNLVLRDGTCFAVNAETGAETELSGVSCRPL
jgi:hypothetical protein